MVVKADYSKISTNYDRGRPISEDTINILFDYIKEIVGKDKEIKLLDLGCGTGRFSLLFVYKLGYSVVGADTSKEMLKKAIIKDKNRKIQWEIQDAQSLKYSDKTFDIVFISHLLHHVDRPIDVVKESFRVLKPGGILFNRYGAMENIQNDPEHKFFPGVLEIDKVRTPTKKQVELWFHQAGFINIKSKIFKQNTWKNAIERWERNKLKPTSVLTMITKSDLDKGLKKLHQYISKHPFDSWLLEDRLTLTYGMVKK